ncbi:LCP family protein [Streptomyces sp. MJP52]|uniref:LCP family protein n=1 Tax=Streptomyces sp. MJP52 TaxID=2940555 RepID=UPI002474260C|nr:LCP family protein [Streptomyces sp. MJP52]MDH6227008.1 anionic cell wall polymer biosynthesis LytR-Cps2A-Psr (LCP) family protein [Streptomyces sp. MJP52]
MNDRYDAGHAGHGGDQYELVGYDEYGQPVYRQVPRQAGPQGYPPPPHGGQEQQPRGGHEPQAQGYGYDPYAGGQGPRQPSATGYDSYDHGSHDHGSYGAGGPGTGQQAPVPPAPPAGPAGPSHGGHRGGPPPGGPGQHPQQPPRRPAPGQGPGPQPYGGPGAPAGRPAVAEPPRIPQQGGPGQAPRRDAGPGYDTEQFAFVEEQDGESEDVIDWLQFTENRTERREEAKRRARARMTAVLVVLALVVVSGGGYLWYAGKLPFLSSSDAAQGSGSASGAQKRDVIVVHLHPTKGSDTSTLLLVDNATTEEGSAVLLPNSLALTDQDGNATTLGQSVGDDGSSGTRESLDTVLGTRIEGTWRLDTPFLQNLVDIVGHIEIDTDTDVPDPKAEDEGAAPLVHKGEQQTLSGKMAAAYATHRGPSEPQSAQLERFGQVMRGVLRKLSSDEQGATVTVQQLGQIIEPPLSDKDLGRFLAGLADRAKGGDYRTTVLPVEADGTLGEKASQNVVEKILGGQAKSPGEDGDGVRVSLRNATGGSTNAKDQPLADLARVALVNGGYTYVAAGSAEAAATSEVRYADAGAKDEAIEVARTLGLPESSVTKGATASNADVTVVLGQDYEPAS